jgi:hypothetical protein
MVDAGKGEILHQDLEDEFGAGETDGSDWEAPEACGRFVTAQARNFLVGYGRNAMRRPHSQNAYSPNLLEGRRFRKFIAMKGRAGSHPAI